MIRLIIFLAAIITAINANAEIVDVKQDETTAKYALVDEKGTLVTDYIYSHVGNRNESNLLLVCRDNLYGYIDITTGKEVITPKYAKAGNFNNGLAYVKFDSKYGYIDTEGNMVISPIYDSADDFENGIALVEINDLCGAINTEGKIVVPLKYEDIDYIENSHILYIENANEECGAIDYSGRTVIPMKYDDLGEEVINGCLTVENTNGDFTSGVINLQGKEILPCKYYDTRTEPNCILAKDGKSRKWGVFNYNGKQITPFCIELGGKIHENENIIIGDNNGKWGAYSISGKLIINPQYTHLGKFNNGYAIALKGDTCGLIDTNNNAVMPFDFDAIQYIGNGMYFAKKHKAKGAIYNDNGEQLTEAIYDKAFTFSNGYAKVQAGNKYSIIDTKGKQADKWAFSKYFGIQSMIMKSGGSPDSEPFSSFAKARVERGINSWQQRGEYEKSEMWKARVSGPKRQAKIDELIEIAKQEYLSKYMPNNEPTFSIGKYDPDNECFKITSSAGEMLLSVPIDEAQRFKENWIRVEKIPRYGIVNDRVGIEQCDFRIKGKTYTYDYTTSLSYKPYNDIAYNFEPVEIKSNKQETKKAAPKPSATPAESDVDSNIPLNDINNTSTIALIIGNENYRREMAVPFAASDATAFNQYCTRTLGIPASNVHMVKDATLNDIRAEFSWLKRVARAFKGEASIILYYAGHGIPDEATRVSYLLPVDGYASDVASTGFPLDKIYEELGDIDTRKTVVILDACFSGAERGGKMLSSARGTAIKPRMAEPDDNTVVISATQGDETAYAYGEKGHGMFTYFLLKKLKESKGNASLGELFDYVNDNVVKCSLLINNKQQTPTVISGEDISGSWKSIILTK